MNGVEQTPIAYHFGRNYLAEVVLARPYWRSNDEAAEQAEEVLEQIDQNVKTYVVRSSTLEALRTEMKLGQETIPNPLLVRPRYARSAS